MNSIQTAFQSLLRILIFARSNRLKIQRYILNYRSGERFIFNDLFRILLERNETQFLLSLLEKEERILGSSANLLVFKILIYQKMSDSEKVRKIFAVLLTKKLKISPYYFDLNLFRDAYSLIAPNQSLKDLAKLFRVNTSALWQKFILGHILCMTDSNQFMSELMQFESEINENKDISSDLHPLEITDIQDICSTHTTISPSHPLNFKEPTCFGETEAPADRSVPVPAAVVWTVKNCQLIRASQIVKDKNFVVYEKSGNPKIGFVAGIWNFVVLIRNSNKVLVSSNFNKINHHKTGVLIAGRCSRNYFHWLIEYVPKILNIIKIQKLDSPLLVDDTMPEQSYAILDYICEKYSLCYIRVNPKELLSFDELIVPSQHTFQPDDPSFTHWESSALSAEHIDFVSQMGLELANKYPNTVRYEKVYLSRKNFTARKIVNEAEIESLFRKHGFEIVDPTDLDFIKQVQLFSNARIIASPTGAALSNLIFCKENATVLSLVASENKGFCIQSNMAQLKKLNFMHVTGELVQSREAFNSYQEYRFSEFKMNIENLEHAILAAESQL